MSDEQAIFVIKGTTPSGGVFWLTAPDSDGLRHFGPRGVAEQFTDRSKARSVIDNMPRPFRDAGIFFLVMWSPTNADKKCLRELLVKTLGENSAAEIECISNQWRDM